MPMVLLHHMNISILTAQPSDLDELYALGNSTPELQTSATSPFMDRDELRASLQYPGSIFLCARVEGKIVGFICANTIDLEHPLAKNWACIVYVAVQREYRRHGVMKVLGQACLTALKDKGISNVYAWARADGEILALLEKYGFTKGHEYVWMDRRI